MPKAGLARRIDLGNGGQIDATINQAGNKLRCQRGMPGQRVCIVHQVARPHLPHPRWRVVLPIHVAHADRLAMEDGCSGLVAGREQLALVVTHDDHGVWCGGLQRIREAVQGGLAQPRLALQVLRRDDVRIPWPHLGQQPLSIAMASMTGLRSSKARPERGSMALPVPGFSVANNTRSVPTTLNSNSSASLSYVVCRNAGV